MSLTTQRIIAQGFIFFIFIIVLPAFALAQVRGVYPLGMSATNSGVTPPSGFTYSNVFLIYSRDQFKDPNGVRLPVSGNQSVLLDMNSFVWVSTKTIFGGAKFSASATLPIAKNSLTSEVQGKLSGANGFGDSYYQPFILGWQKNSADIRVVYGFLAPTGRFQAGADDNVGSGYWTHVASSAVTIYLTKDKTTNISVFEMYEFHTRQEGTDIHPGQTLSLDYSITHSIGLRTNMRLQFGLVGYEQWQTTDKTGPAVTQAQAAAHYRVNALGFASSVSFPSSNVSLGMKYFKEFSNESTFQGYSLQFSGGISF